MDDGGKLLFVADGAAVVLHGLEDRLREELAVAGGGDQFCVVGICLEAALDQNAGDRNVADDDETRALQPAVEHARLHDERGVCGGRKRDVFRVARVAAAVVEVRDGRAVGHHRGDAARRERVGFDARAVAAGIEMDGDENPAFVLVRDASPILERDEGVVAAREHDFQARGLEQRLRTHHHVERKRPFRAVDAHRAGVVPAVAGIEDDGVNRFRILNPARTHDGLDELHEIETRDAHLPVALNGRVAEDELEIVDEKIRRAGRRANVAHAGARARLAVAPLHRTEAVKLGDVVHREVVAPVRLHHDPVLRTGCRAGARQSCEHDCEQDQESVHRLWKMWCVFFSASPGSRHGAAVEPAAGFEPATFRLQIERSTN